MVASSSKKEQLKTRPLSSLWVMMRMGRCGAALMAAINGATCDFTASSPATAMGYRQNGLAMAMQRPGGVGVMKPCFRCGGSTSPLSVDLERCKGLLSCSAFLSIDGRCTDGGLAILMGAPARGMVHSRLTINRPTILKVSSYSSVQVLP